MRALAAGLAACTIVFNSGSLHAQDTFAPPTLEELIPDEAVADPEGWALEGAPSDAQAAEAAPPEIEADSPLAEMPEIGVPWPEDLELPQLAPLEPEEDIEFAELEDPLLPPAPAFETRRIDDNLVLAYPESADAFPPREDFVARFEALSTLEELESDESSVAQLVARSREDEELLNNLLRVYGYYDALVTRIVGSENPGEDEAERPDIRFEIIPGPRYTFGAIDLGDLDQAPDFGVLRRAFEIESGMDMSSDRIVEEQFDIDRMLGETGYAFAEIDEPELLIDHARQEGDLTLEIRPNGKYAFGEVVSNDPDFLPGEHLATIARFEPGDIYQRSLELDLRRAITATGLVSSVTITPREVEPAAGGELGTVAIDVEMSRAPLRTIAGAIGYGSEEGIRLQASWEHRNLFPPEGALRVRGIVGTREQLAGITFRKNNFGGRDRILTLDAYATTIDSDAFDARTAAIVGTYERVSNLLFQKPFSWGAGFEIIATRERPAAVDGVAQPRQTFFVGALPVNALIDTTDDLLDPTEGWRLGGRLSPEVSRTNGVESFYLRSMVDASYYRSISEGKVIAGRVRFGSIPGTALENIAPSRRYYAGGGSSVRGYGYQQIGPRNEFGEPSGGRSVVEASLEARIRTGLLGGAVAVVPFVDAGSVSTGAAPDFEEIKIGAGLGLRYHTGFGPIRVDVGVPLNPEEGDSPVGVYVSLGQAF